MNNVKFIILYDLAAKKSEILYLHKDFCDWSISSHSIWKVMPSDILPSTIHSGIMLYIYSHPTLINRLKPWFGGVPMFNIIFYARV